MNMEYVQLSLAVVNVLVLPALVAAGRWLMKIELRMARVEWRLQEIGTTK